MTITVEAHFIDLPDEEMLVDLLFRQAGWQRLGEVGDVRKTLAIVLMPPITGAVGYPDEGLCH